MDKDSSIDGLLKESEDFMFSSEDEQEEEGGKAKLPLLVRGKPKRGDGDSRFAFSEEVRSTGNSNSRNSMQASTVYLI